MCDDERKELAKRERMTRAAKFMAMTREQQLAYVLKAIYDQARVATETVKAATRQGGEEV